MVTAEGLRALLAEIARHAAETERLRLERASLLAERELLMAEQLRLRAELAAARDTPAARCVAPGLTPEATCQQAEEPEFMDHTSNPTDDGKSSSIEPSTADELLERLRRRSQRLPKSASSGRKRRPAQSG
jgi:hypothetical protein